MRWKVTSLALLLSCTVSFAHAGQESAPKISIIIDDLGNNQYWDYKVAQLPGPVVCSILPYTFYSLPVARVCHSYSKEIILHTPMQAIAPHSLGPGGLTVNLSQSQFETVLTQDIRHIPYASGINNHMGSLLTEKPMQMEWVMQVIKPQGLFYIDSRTSGASIAEQVARDEGVPTASRDVFLDDVRTTAAVRGQFEILLADARKNGAAIAIGHPYAPTIMYLEQEIPRLQAQGYQLVPVSDLLHHSVESNIHPVIVLPLVAVQQAPKLAPEKIIASSIQTPTQPKLAPKIIPPPSQIIVLTHSPTMPAEQHPIVVVAAPIVIVKPVSHSVVVPSPPPILWRTVVDTQMAELNRLWKENFISWEISADLLQIKVLNTAQLLLENFNSNYNRLMLTLEEQQQAGDQFVQTINFNATHEIASLPNPTLHPAVFAANVRELQKKVAISIASSLPLLQPAKVVQRNAHVIVEPYIPTQTELTQKNVNVIVEPYQPLPTNSRVLNKPAPINVVMKAKPVPTSAFPLELSHITPLESFLLDVLQYKLCPQSMESCRMWY